MTTVSGKVAAIYVYPIKSCAPVALSQSMLTPLGLAYDRQWLIVDETGRFQTQRQIPHLAWIEATPTADGLCLSAPNQKELTVASVSANGSNAQPVEVTIWHDTVTALDAGEPAAVWLNNFLQSPSKRYRLVQFDPRQPRLSDKHWTGHIDAPYQFADGFSVNVLSLAAMQGFNERLMQRGLDGIGIERFRPNIVIEGFAAHEEDLLRYLTLPGLDSDIIIELVKPCPRCQIPAINPQTASIEPEINDVLQSYRQLPAMNDAVCFGMNGIVREGAGKSIKLGDAATGTYDFRD